jgi:hypothetical protein
MPDRSLALALLLLAAAGCVTPDPDVIQLPATPLGPQPAGRVVQLPSAASSEAVGKRVSLIGQRLLAENRQLNLNPFFSAAGFPDPEVFHQGTDLIVVTEGLAQKCSDDQLAAVLSVQLAEMAAERQAAAAPARREPAREALPPLGAGTDGATLPGGPDQTYLAEAAAYDKERKRAVAQATALPVVNAQAAARDILANAKYPATALDEAQPVLREAARNRAVERQFTGAGSVRPWVP